MENELIYRDATPEEIEAVRKRREEFEIEYVYDFDKDEIVVEEK